MIPAEAVEAAARALTVEVYGVDMFDGMSDDAQEVLRRRGTFLLEAAAPYMLAEAWQAGHNAGYNDGFDGSGVTPNPYEDSDGDD